MSCPSFIEVIISINPHFLSRIHIITLFLIDIILLSLKGDFLSRRDSFHRIELQSHIRGSSLYSINRASSIVSPIIIKGFPI